MCWSSCSTWTLYSILRHFKDFNTREQKECRSKFHFLFCDSIGIDIQLLLCSVDMCFNSVILTSFIQSYLWNWYMQTDLIRNDRGARTLSIGLIMTWGIISHEIIRKSIRYLDLCTKSIKLQMVAVFYFRFLRNNNAKKLPLCMVPFYKKSILRVVPLEISRSPGAG